MKIDIETTYQPPAIDENGETGHIRDEVRKSARVVQDRCLRARKAIKTALGLGEALSSVLLCYKADDRPWHYSIYIDLPNSHRETCTGDADTAVVHLSPAELRSWARVDAVFIGIVMVLPNIGQKRWREEIMPLVVEAAVQMKRSAMIHHALADDDSKRQIHAVK